jgi:hypothetical protein
MNVLWGIFCFLSLTAGKLIMERYTYTFNAQVVNMTLKMDGAGKNGSDFSYDIDATYKVDLKVQNGKG